MHEFTFIKMSRVARASLFNKISLFLGVYMKYYMSVVKTLKHFDKIRQLASVLQEFVVLLKHRLSLDCTQEKELFEWSKVIDRLSDQMLFSLN